MASSVTTPLERQFGQMPALAQMTSGRARRAARRSRCSSRSTATSTPPRRTCRPRSTPRASVLPRDAAEPADLQQEQPRRHADPHPGAHLRHAAARQGRTTSPTSMLAQKISQVTGVGLVTIERRPEARGARAGRSRRARPLGLSLEDVRTALVQANVNQPKGNFDGPRQAYAIGANDQLFSSAEYRAVIIAYRNGAPVRLADVGRGHRRRRERAARRLGRTTSPPSSSTSSASPARTSSTVADRVKALLPQLRASLPASVQRVHPRPTAPRPSAPRSTTCSSRWC